MTVDSQADSPTIIGYKGKSNCSQIFFLKKKMKRLHMQVQTYSIRWPRKYVSKSVEVFMSIGHCHTWKRDPAVAYV